MSQRSILNLRMNQDNTYLSCSMETGLKVFNIDPLVQKVNLGADLVGSVAITEMLFHTNLLALVGGGNYPKFDEKAVLIWDESKPKGDKILMDITFTQPVLNVRLLKDKLIIVLRQEIHIFSFPVVKRLRTFDTADNPKGLCEVSAFGGVLVFPAVNNGHIQIIHLENIQPGQSASPIILQCHKTKIACIAVSQCGSLIATASVKGTLIRIYETATRKQIVELRRGTDSALFYCMSFSPDAAFLCASSDKGTVHIFAVKDTALNSRSALTSVGFLGTYGESQRSMANFSISSECPCLCAFTDNQNVLAACVDGSIQKQSFTLKGDCHRKTFDVFLDIGDNIE